MPTPRKTAASKTAEAKPPAEPPPPSAPAKLQVIDLDGTKVAVFDPDATAIWARLTASFPPDWVEKLPKVLRRDDQDKGRCEQGRNYSADGHYCGGWHARAVHLDYVGHAGITMRLNDVVGPDGWTFRPLAVDPNTGAPLLTRDVFWGELTILGVSKVEVAANFSSPQEAMGDCLRRCAMRFGMGTYLWSKSDQALVRATRDDVPPEPVPEPEPTPETHPELYAPNGQPWLTPEGKPNADALEPHQRKVFDTIGVLVGDEPGRFNAWHAQEKLPAIRAMDEWQAAAAMSKLEELVGQRQLPPA